MLNGFSALRTTLKRITALVNWEIGDRFKIVNMARPKRVLLPGLNKIGPKTEWLFEAGHMVAGSSGVYDGRRLGKGLSDDSQNMLISIEDAFDDGVLDILSFRQRQCFIDVIISGESYDVVAARYGLRPGSVKFYVRVAAQKIRREIEKNNG